MTKIKEVATGLLSTAEKMNEVIKKVNKLQERVEVLRKSARYSLLGLKSIIGMGKSEESSEMVKKLEKLLGELGDKVK